MIADHLQLQTLESAAICHANRPLRHHHYRGHRPAAGVLLEGTRKHDPLARWVQRQVPRVKSLRDGTTSALRDDCRLYVYRIA